jgi:hypothetical protein
MMERLFTSVVMFIGKSFGLVQFRRILLDLNFFELGVIVEKIRKFLAFNLFNANWLSIIIEGDLLTVEDIKSYLFMIMFVLFVYLHNR